MSELKTAHWWVNRLGYDKVSSEIAVTAGYGSGKTFGCWQWLVSEMTKHPDGKIWCFTEPTYGLIDKVAISTFRVLARAVGAREGRHFKIVSGQSPRIDLLKNKQTILLLSMDSPDSLVGFEACKGVSDEHALNREESDQRLSGRMRGKGVNINQLLKPTTPEGMNWFSDLFDSEAQPGWRYIDEYDSYKVEPVHTETGLVNTVKRRIRLTTYMNQMNLPSDYIAKIIKSYGHDQNYIDSYVYGHFRPFSKGLAYKEYKGVLHKMPAQRPDREKIVNLTWDFNISPVWVAIQEQIEFEPMTRKRKVYDLCLDNANQDGETLTEAIAEFAAKFPVSEFYNTPIHLFGDASGHSGSHKNLKAGDTDYKFIKRTLHNLGYQAVVICAHNPPNPLERLSVEAVNTAFLNDRLRVTEICDRVLKSLSRTSWANNKKANLDKPKDDTWTHPMDAVKYYIWAKNNNKRTLI